MGKQLQEERGAGLEDAISNARLYQAVFEKPDVLVSHREGVDLAERTRPIENAQLIPGKFHAHIHIRPIKELTAAQAKVERLRELFSVFIYRASSNDYNDEKVRKLRVAIDNGTFRLTEEERAAKIAEYQMLSKATFQDGLTLEERRQGITESNIAKETLEFERSFKPADRRIMRLEGFTVRGSKRPGRGRKRKVRKNERERLEELWKTTLYWKVQHRWWLHRVFKTCRLIGLIVEELHGLAQYHPRDRDRTISKLRQRFRYDDLREIPASDEVRLAIAAFSARTMQTGSRDYRPDLDLALTVNECFSVYEATCKKLGASLFEQNQKIKLLILNNFYLSLSGP
jgi:hypothetical protein